MLSPEPSAAPAAPAAPAAATTAAAAAAAAAVAAAAAAAVAAAVALPSPHHGRRHVRGRYGDNQPRRLLGGDRRGECGHWGQIWGG